jgi:glycerol-3-phosphate dehydrogenase
VPTTKNPPQDRLETLNQLSSQNFDIVVIGGGITGLGVALDAASRGLSVALVERDDLASGTSSKSSKLIHGGLRYLQQGEVRLVYEALHERQRLRRNAPHLVQTLPFMIPILKREGVVSKKIARALGSAMWMYDLTGGWRIGKLHRRLKADKAFTHLPTMQKDRLSSAYVYFDAMADDARVCVALARTAISCGAVISNYTRVDKILHDSNGRACGVLVTPNGKQSFEIRAQVVINAAGVWSDEVLTTDLGYNPDSIRPAKGVHLTVPWKKIRNDIAVVIPVPGDKRSLFLVPWISNYDGTYQYTYVGTTDTDYQGAINDPQCTNTDIEYVLKAMNAAVTTGITREDITAVWSGLRPLVKSVSDEKISSRTADLSRRHKVATSQSGMITVTGGKLTTYRKMAQDAVDTALLAIGRRSRCKTKSLSLVGATTSSAKTSDAQDQHLLSRFGSESKIIKNLIADDKNLGEQLIPGLPYLRAEAVFAVTHELATTLDDILSRRTRCRIINRRATVAGARNVAELVAPLLGWSEQEINNEVLAFVDSCAQEDEAAISN